MRSSTSPLSVTKLVCGVGLTLALLSPRAVRADEGQWTPDQLAELDQAKLASMGLELSPAQLWNPDGDEKTGGLMRAAINLGGCSAAFVSTDGLIATNHHCAYGALQANSTPEHDYLADGFLATKRSDELEAKGRPVRVLRRIEDVTDEVVAAADGAGDDDAARARAIERVEKSLVAACEEDGASCQVASFYNGKRYRLFEYLEITDVRLVFAPPAAVGEYGGEVDNWMWPRHTGDFSLLRAYVGPDGKPAPHAAENVPYHPEQWLKVSAEGVAPDDFVAVLGYPGRTRRYMPAAEVARWVEQVLPLTVDLYGEWIEILERHGDRDEATKIKVAATKKSLANRHKNARGMLDGIDHMKLVARRKKEDEQLATWVAEGHDGYADVLPALEELSAEARTHHVRDTLLGAATRGPNALAIAVDVVRRAESSALPDLERPGAYMERAADRLWKAQERRVRDFDPAVDAEVLAMILARNEALPADEQIPALHAVAANGATETAGQMDAANELVSGSEIATSADAVKAAWARTPKQIAASKDPLVALARGLSEELADLDERRDANAGRRTRIYPRYFDMLEAVRKGPIYPDANGTLRMSYATVKGYDKWDGQAQSPQTVLAGAVAKHTGKDPFDLPKAFRDAASGASNTYWADPRLGDVPLCFLSNADTTGGNSGSPVINGRGELVGFNFDRVWENIAGDFGYNPGHSRNITADVRYLLWTLDEVSDAGPLLDELGVGKLRDAPPRKTPETAPSPEPGPAETSKAASAATTGSKAGCACDVRMDDRDGSTRGVLGLLGLAMFVLPVSTRARRRR